MAVIRAQGITKEFGAQCVLDDISFEIGDNDKIGLIGVNGSGKTTLIRILLGIDPPTAGSIQRSSDIRIGYVPQYVTFQEDQTVMDYLMKEHRGVEEKLRTCEHQLAEAAPEDAEKRMRAYQRVRDEYDRIDGELYEAQAERMLAAFGLSDRMNRAVSVLSGGEQNILAITKALLARPDLLVLDEPANHLDYVGIAWLENFLKNFKGAVLIVSHNRYLLDQIVTTVFEVSQARLARYPGNYSDYRAQKLRRQIQQEKEYETYSRQLVNLEAMVLRIRNIAQAYSDKSWGRRLRSRQSQLDKLKSSGVDRPENDPSAATIRITGEQTHANIVLRLRNYRKQYGDRILLQDVDLDITSGERVALVGPNGSGKTSLLRDIMEHGHWDNPVIRIGPSMNIGYCAQQQEVLHPESTIFMEIMACGARSNQNAREVLARFLFFEDDLHKKVKNLSGGERNRLQLARLILQNPNVLILDEPTNHLDIQTREAVEAALDDYKGTLLVVSHDRYFLDKLADRVLEVTDRTLRDFQGSYSEFWYAREQRENESREQKEREKERERAARRQRQESQSTKSRGGNPWKLKKSEEMISTLEKRTHACEHEMADAFANGDHVRGTALMQELETRREELEKNYEEWLSMQGEE